MHSRAGGAALARVEVPLSDLPRAVELREQLVAGLRQLGFHYVVLDLEGFRSGRQNEILREQRLLPTVEGESS